MKNGALFAVLLTGLYPQGQTRRPLSSADIDAIARLVMLEDTRQLNADLLAPIVKSAHPEVRRRGAIAIGRIAKPAGAALLASMRDDPDPAVAAAVVFATGQLREPASVPWLATVLSSQKTASAREAAIALGKVQPPDARAALAQYLQSVQRRAELLPVIGEALLSMGRFPTGGDLRPIPPMDARS